MSFVWSVSWRNTLCHYSTCIVTACSGFISRLMLLLLLPRGSNSAFVFSGLWSVVVSTKVGTITSLKSLVSLTLLNWVWKDHGVDLWNGLAVMFVFVSTASMRHLWFSFGCEWMGTVHSSGAEDTFVGLYCLYTDCLVQFWLLSTHDFSTTVAINNWGAVGLAKSN